MAQSIKTTPTYAIASVDNALRIATMLQLEGAMTVADVAERLGVARSTAHRLLAMLVYRDFATQDSQHLYHAGLVLELAGHSKSRVSRLREDALPYLQRLVRAVGESANICIRTGDTARFIASVECLQAFKVGSREGMVFPAHLTTAGLLSLTELREEELDELYSAENYEGRLEARPDLLALKKELAGIRRSDFVMNKDRSERGVFAIGVPLRAASGEILAGLSVSMPSVRYDRNNLPSLVATLRAAAKAIEAEQSRSADQPETAS